MTRTTHSTHGITHSLNCHRPNIQQNISAVHSILFNSFLSQTLGFLESAETSFKALHSQPEKQISWTLASPPGTPQTHFSVTHTLSAESLFSVWFLGNSKKITHYFFLCLLVYDLFLYAVWSQVLFGSVIGSREKKKQKTKKSVFLMDIIAVALYIALFAFRENVMKKIELKYQS
jgi:hypothetical protein